MKRLLLIMAILCAGALWYAAEVGNLDSSMAFPDDQGTVEWNSFLDNHLLTELRCCPVTSPSRLAFRWTLGDKSRYQTALEKRVAAYLDSLKLPPVPTLEPFLAPFAEGEADWLLAGTVFNTEDALCFDGFLTRRDSIATEWIPRFWGEMMKKTTTFPIMEEQRKVFGVATLIKNDLTGEIWTLYGEPVELENRRIVYERALRGLPELVLVTTEGDGPREQYKRILFGAFVILELLLLAALWMDFRIKK